MSWGVLRWEFALASRRTLKHWRLGIAIVIAIMSGSLPGLLIVSAERAILPPVPFPRADELITISEDSEVAGSATSLPKFGLLAEAKTVALAAFSSANTQLQYQGRSLPVRVELVSENFATVVGVQPALGRISAPNEQAIMLGYQFWAARLGKDPNVIGSTIYANEVPLTVVGILPRDFGGYLSAKARQYFTAAAAYVPLRLAPSLFPRRAKSILTDPESPFLAVLGRVRPGYSTNDVRAELALLNRRLNTVFPQRPTSKPEHYSAVPFAESAVDPQVLRAIRLLQLPGTLVLILSGVNIAGLFVARVFDRADVAVMSALGLPESAPVRVAFWEALIPTACGGVTSMAAAALLLKIARSVFSAPISIGSFEMRFAELQYGLPAYVILALYPPVLSISLALVTRAELRKSALPRVMTGGSRMAEIGLRSLGIRRARGIALLIQVALAFSLAIPTALLFRSVVALLKRDPGFRPQGAIAVALPPNAEPESLQQLLVQVREIPEVASSGVVSCLPLSQSCMGTVFTSIDRDHSCPTTLHLVSPSSFDALGIRAIAGHTFGTEDGESAVVISEAAARCLQVPSPLQRSIVLGQQQYTVVGVVADAPYETLVAPVLPAVYVPIQTRALPSTTLVVKTRPSASSFAAVRDRIASDEPRLKDAAFINLETSVNSGLVPYQAALGLLSFSTAIGFGLLATGIFGSTTAVVAKASRGIAIEIACGATPRQVSAQVLRAVAKIACAGIVLGGALAAIAVEYGRPLLYNIRPFDPTTWTLALALTAVTVLAAGWAPARRAASVKPATLLRQL